MMLKPFRIRSLYDSSPGVVQLSTVQYDATIKSQPEAALSYLDDDDGETILVGSSFELEQRLDEPIPLRKIRGRLASSTSGDILDSSMHTFDINKSPASLATWREHEAYTSKTLHKSPLKSPSTGEPQAVPAIPTCDSMAPAPPLPLAPPTQPVLAVALEDAIKGALQGLESHVGAFAGFLQDTSNTLRTVAENTRDADVSAVGGILDGFRGIFQEVGRVGMAMVEAFDGEALVQAPAFSQPVARDSSIRASAPEELTARSPSIGNVVPSTSTSKDVLPNATEPSPDPAEPPTPSKAMSTDHDVAKRLDVGIEGNAKLYASSSTYDEPSERATNNKGPFGKPLVAPFAAYASLEDPWKINPERRTSRESDCSNCQMSKKSCKRYLFSAACHTCIVDKQSCSFVTGTPSIVPPPSVTAAQTRECTGMTPDEFVAPTDFPPQQFPVQQHGQIHLLRETAKSYGQPHNMAISRSILDLENSDPDFSTRYPPLMSLRKSKTISSLADRSRSPFLANINPEAAISRFPSLSQIEREARSDRRAESLGKASDAVTRPWNLVKDGQNSRQSPAYPRLVIPGRAVGDVATATLPTLPGAWPEARPEAEGPTRPTSEESSGAFFDRMTRSRSPGPATRSFRYIPAHLGQSHTSGAQYVPRHLREPLVVDTTNLPRHLRHTSSVDTMAPQLGRSKTVTASNPAARLTRPFDPLEDARQSRDANGVPKRSGTERYRRRPYNDSFTGAGRMPWESFEQVPRSVRPAAARPEPRSSRHEYKPFSNTDQSAGLGFGISDKVADCVGQLRDMGYGNRSPHEASRLSIYAAACNGEVVDAVEMIEEDRKAGRQHKSVGDKLGVRAFNHNERPSFGF